VVLLLIAFVFFFQAEDGIRDFHVTGVQTCALPIFEVYDRHRGPAAVTDPNEDVVAVRAQGTTNFHLLPALGKPSQSYQRCAEAQIGRASWRDRGYMRVRARAG